MKKRILISAYNLDVGGIEKGLINLLKVFDLDKYEITLVLKEKEGIFLKDVDKKINIIEYSISNSRNLLYRKIINRLNLLKWIRKNKNKYDFAISYTTYFQVGARLALNASKNNALWIHSNYENIYKKDSSKIKKFFNDIYISSFKNIVFVSKDSMIATTKYFKEIESRSIVCNNIIDYNDILTKAKEKIPVKKNNKIVFLNVSRHDEDSKKLSRIIEATQRLKELSYHFEVWLVGDGDDNLLYKTMVNDYNLEEYVKFFGMVKNPYPYYKEADCFILSSMYEGYPVVFIESMLMKLPIITTKVSDYEEVEDGFGMVVENSLDGVYDGMKNFLDNGLEVTKVFDAKKFNESILLKIYNMIEES